MSKVLLKIFLLVMVVAGLGYAVKLYKNNRSETKQHALIIPTIYGDCSVEDPLAIDLINNDVMQRLKKIHQYGFCDYIFNERIIYDRFIHSVGVYYLLKRYNCPREEQIAGLLHDASHTVFSHACDPLFMGNFTSGAYQDEIHEEFLNDHGVGLILKKYGYTVQDVLHKNPQFKGLDQELPDMCADRIEYNLFAGMMDGFLTKAELEFILDHLNFDGKRWYFDDIDAALKFAMIPLHETIHRWGSAENIFMCNEMCAALKRAWDMGMISKEDITFNITDDDMWKRLQESNDPVIKSSLKKAIDHHELFEYAQANDPDAVTLKSKFRGIDPLVKINDGFKRLTELVKKFKDEYNRIRNIMRSGWHVKIMPT